MDFHRADAAPIRVILLFVVIIMKSSQWSVSMKRHIQFLIFLFSLALVSVGGRDAHQGQAKQENQEL
ncbi:MAG: hypothetical protein D6790_11950, partial [Caldilineae bacterium]